MIDKTEWLGEWVNFEYLIDSDNRYIQKAWDDVEKFVLRVPALKHIFNHGVKKFWRRVCDTNKYGLKNKIGGCVVSLENEKIFVEWYDIHHHNLGKYAYIVDTVIEHGLDNKTNTMYVANYAPLDFPFRFILALDPVPTRKAYRHSGLISHVHFQFAKCRDDIVDENDNLLHPMWYPTICDNVGDILAKCNIIRALHRLNIWDELPVIKEDNY